MSGMHVRVLEDSFLSSYSVLIYNTYVLPLTPPMSTRQPAEGQRRHVVWDPHPHPRVTVGVSPGGPMDIAQSEADPGRWLGSLHRPLVVRRLTSPPVRIGDLRPCLGRPGRV